MFSMILLHLAKCHDHLATTTQPIFLEQLYLHLNILLLILQTSMSAVLIPVTPMLCVLISKALLSVLATMDSLEMDSIAKVVIFSAL